MENRCQDCAYFDPDDNWCIQTQSLVRPRQEACFDFQLFVEEAGTVTGFEDDF